MIHIIYINDKTQKLYIAQVSNRVKIKVIVCPLINSLRHKNQN